MISRHANQFAGMQCDGDVEVFWHEAGPAALHGWYWRPADKYQGLDVKNGAVVAVYRRTAAQGPSSTSRDALLDAINRGHVYTSKKEA